MRRDEIERVRAELDGGVLVADAQGSASQGWAVSAGLMLGGRRKSMQPMGDRLDGDYQQLQQFVWSSPWPVEPARRRRTRKAVEVIGPQAWVADDTGFVRSGPASPGVARQYSGTLGKVGNVKIGVSVHAVTDAASCPLGWRLSLPESWDETCSETNEHAEGVAARRAKAQISESVRHRPKWEVALEMIDELNT